MDEAGPMDIANGVQRSGSGAGRGGKGGRGQMRGMLTCLRLLSECMHLHVNVDILSTTACERFLATACQVDIRHLHQYVDNLANRP